MLDLRRLQYFVAVADARHFARAAAALHVAQPAVSQQIQRLERELGVTLFRRDTRPLSLTSAGELLLGEARALLERAQAVEGLVRQVREGTRGVLRLGTPADLPAGLLPDLLARFAADHPDVRVVPVAQSSERSLAGLSRDELDLALVRRIPTGGEFRSRILLEEDLGVVLARTHPLAGRTLLHAPDLSGEHLVMPVTHLDDSFEGRLLARLRAAGAEPGEPVLAGEPAGAYDLAAAGLGVWVTYRRSSDRYGRHDRRATWRPLHGFTVTLGLVWSAREPAPAARHFVDAVTGAAHDPGDGLRVAVPGAGARASGGPAVAS
ncbi:MAG TPA: LysR family transcriptional regulator [Geodermatophilus sp.]|nr:LysR family transcriptional regulator [Geodermatophilus sp.]